MNREWFTRELLKANDTLDKKELKHQIQRSVDSIKDDNPRGHNNLIIVMEELSELQKTVAKELRGKGNTVGMLEEIADVAMGILYLQEVCDISTSDIYRAINVKCDRLKLVLDMNGEYR